MKIIKLNKKHPKIKISEISTIKNGFAFKNQNLKTGVKWLTIKNIQNGNIDWSTTSYLPEKYLTEYPSFVLKQNDIVMALTRPVTNDLLKVAVIDQLSDNSLLNQRNAKITPKKNCNDKFLYQLFLSYKMKNEVKKAVQGTDPPNVSSKQIENFEFNIPNDIAEQEKIATVLSQQEEQVNKIKTLIEKLEKRNQYYAERLLSGELRVREGRDGEIEFHAEKNLKIADVNGKNKNIPHKWDVEQIGSKQLSILSGGLDYFENEKEYFATGEVGYLNNYKSPTEIITYENRASRANMQPKANSVWLARMQFTNKFLSFENEDERIKKIVLSTGFAGIEVGNEFCLDFVKHFVMSNYFTKNKDSRCQGGTQKAINNENLKTMSILKPSIKEQYLISNVLNKMTIEKTKVEKLLEKEQKRFDWMSDALLSGEYQVID